MYHTDIIFLSTFAYNGTIRARGKMQIIIHIKKEGAMLVEYWMSTPVITIDAKDSFTEATARLKENNISVMPVMKNEKLVGIITDREKKHTCVIWWTTGKA